jgi:hypothetical protein
MLPTRFFEKWTLYRFLGVFSSKFSRTIAQAAATPVYLATARNDCLDREKVYWNTLVETEPSEEALDSVLAYRLWEISESLLIDLTGKFDSYLRTGDKFSSVSQIDTPNTTPPSANSISFVNNTVNFIPN